MGTMKAVLMDIRVDADLCCGCGLCVIICPQGVFSLHHGVSHAEQQNMCLQCHLCEIACEYHAITVIEEGTTLQG